MSESEATGHGPVAGGASSMGPSKGMGYKGDYKKPKKRKVLLMGKSGSGKSSMRSIIFSNYVARDARRLGATIDIDLSHVKFLSNLHLNLWDCGGHEAFMENYLSQQRVHVFSNVGVLIYVFDIESRDTERDLATYVSIITALLQYSPTAKIYVLIHKMDLIVPGKREEEFVELLNLVRAKTPRRSAIVAAAPPPPSLQQPMSGDSPYQSTGQLQLPAEHGQQQLSDEITITPFATSIWDQSLYKAWASIIHDLVPNLGLIEESLGSLGRLIEAEELLLYERTSFLVVSHWTSEEGALNPIDDRFERMSNILKHFKHSISKYTETPKNAEQLVLLEYKAGLRFAYFFIKFTANTYLQVVLPPGEARFNAAKVNCQIAAEQFKFFDGPHVSNPTMGPS